MLITQMGLPGGMPRPRIERQDLLDALQDLAADLGRTPSYRDVDERGQYSPGTYENHFGSWIDALRAAGFEADGRRNDEVGREGVLALLREVADAVGHPPTTGEFEERTDYRAPLIYKYFEDWETALDAAGLDPDGRPDRTGAIPEAELVAELRAATAALGRPPTEREMNELGEYSVGPFKRAFGSWSAAIEAAGVSE